MTPTAGRFTRTCRWTCSTLIAAPWLYWWLVTDGSAYEFLVLVLLAPSASLVLVANSLVCLGRHRTWRSASLSLLFLAVSLVGVLTARHFLPQFHM